MAKPNLDVLLDFSIVGATQIAACTFSLTQVLFSTNTQAYFAFIRGGSPLQGPSKHSDQTKAKQVLHDELRKAVSIIEPLGGRAEYTLFPGYPPTVNSPEATDIMIKATSDLLGADQVKEAEMGMGAEDFSYMAQQAPGNFLRIGVRNPQWEQIYPVHRNDFRIDEDALPIGAAALAAAALCWMREKR